jgi:hypothetical protein
MSQLTTSQPVDPIWRKLGEQDRGILKEDLRVILDRRVQMALYPSNNVMDMFFKDGDRFDGNSLYRMYRHFLPTKIRETYEMWADNPQSRRLFQCSSYAELQFAAPALYYDGVVTGAIHFDFGLRASLPAVHDVRNGVGLNVEAQGGTEMLEWAQQQLKIKAQNSVANGVLGDVIDACNTVGQLMRIMPGLKPFLLPQQQMAFLNLVKRSKLPENFRDDLEEAVRDHAGDIYTWLAQGQMMPELNGKLLLEVRLT